MSINSWISADSFSFKAMALLPPTFFSELVSATSFFSVSLGVSLFELSSTGVSSALEISEIFQFL